MKRDATRVYTTPRVICAGFVVLPLLLGGDVTLETTTTWREQESEGGKKNKMNGGMAQDGRPGYEENVTNLIEQGGKE